MAFAPRLLAAARRLFGIFAALLFLGPAVAGVISIHAEAGDSSLEVQLHLPRAQQNTLPVIIIVLDAQQQGMRPERYIEHLLAGGFAVLVPNNPTVELGWLLTAARQNPNLDSGRIGLLSFGAGAALTSEIGKLPRALLYPGCGQLSFPREAAPLLVIHGDADPINPPLACAAMALGWEELGPSVTHYVLQGVGYAWDSAVPDNFAPSRLRALGMAHPIAIHPDGAVTEQAADMVVQFFMELLG